MNATRTLRPSASSPWLVDELSAIASPALTRWPRSTIGRWLMHVPWLLRTNFWSRYSSSSPESDSTRIRSAVTLITTPSGLAMHVRAHERAVGVVVLEERDQRGGHGHDLLRAHVHVLDLVRAGLRELV